MRPSPGELREDVGRRFLLIGILLLLMGCGAIVYLCVVSQMDWSVGKLVAYHAPVLRLPQFFIVSLLILAIADIVAIARKGRLKIWRAYIPLGILVLLILSIVLFIPVWARFSIQMKLTDQQGGEVAMRAQAGRVLGKWPTPPHCALSDEIAVLIHYWSFRTWDGRMPVLVWSENNVMPSSELPASPVSCEHLGAEWFFCYLSRPEELVYDYSGLCYLEE